MDRSEKDSLYFIDSKVYNCPFCKRGNVRYTLTGKTMYEDEHGERINVYQIKCSDCNGHSLHFTKMDLIDRNETADYLASFKYDGELDDQFIAHRPGVKYVLDADVPKKLINLIGESEESRQANLLTGASASLRKAIYELLSQEKVLVKNEKTGHTDYRESILKLRDKYARIDPELFNQLAEVQELTSDLVHEDSWKAWEGKQLRFLTGIIQEILEELYAEPARRKRRKQRLDELKGKVSGKKK